MESFSPLSLTSPPRRVRDLSKSESDVFDGRVPRQQSVSSASQLPRSPTRQSISTQLASPCYIKQFNALIEHQRGVHSEERALWHTERQELYEKITQLEASLRRYQSTSSSRVTSPKDRLGSGDDGSWGLPSRDRSRETSTSGTGDEVWRGPKIDAPPTRTFSDLPTQSARSDSRLPSIAEDITTGFKVTSPNCKRAQETSRESPGPSHRPIIGGDQIDKNLDGINFRSSSLNPATGRNIMTPQSPSPQSPQSPSPQSPSPSHIFPGTIQLPPSGLDAPEDQYTKDAGHTPLARRTHFNIDGASSTRSSQSTTPIQPEIERPPLEPQPTRIRVPSERSDSYFPAADETPNDADPELSGPLCLTNDNAEDNSFLSELDSKLQAAASRDLDPPAVSGASENGGSEEVDDKQFEQPEHEPKLRIRRSMNFGSAFGANHCGRDV